MFRIVTPTPYHDDYPHIEVYREETVFHLELLYSNGHKMHLRRYGELYAKPLTPERRAARLRAKRARKVARRAKGRMVKETLARYVEDRRRGRLPPGVEEIGKISGRGALRSGCDG